MAARRDLARQAHETLDANRRDAIALVQHQGLAHTGDVLRAAQKSLEKRLRAAVRGPGKSSFTAAQLGAALAQVRVVTAQVTRGVGGAVVDASDDAAEAGARHAADYLRQADRAFRGVGTQPLAIREASMLDSGLRGARASVLRRLAGGEDEEDEGGHHRARVGILQRYGLETVGHFERAMQVGLVAKKSWAEMQDDLTEASPFLQQAPAHWAARIVRTEVMGAYGRSAQAAVEDAGEQLGDMVKIWSETFDDRTAADSYLTHGQIRRPEEMFDTPYGQVLNPPMRPNDRAIVVPHRIAWPIPPYLQPRSDAEAEAAWRRAGNKRPMDLERPEPRSTVDLARFGAPPTPPRVGR